LTVIKARYLFAWFYTFCRGHAGYVLVESAWDIEDAIVWIRALKNERKKNEKGEDKWTKE
jgi:hypothetical protein